MNRPENGTELLNDLIIQEIRSTGPITFVRYMELALYHPKYGYYQRTVKIGKEGDYYTSPHVSSLFGKIVGKQLVEMWRQIGQPKDFSILEMGAGYGFMGHDILDFFAHESGVQETFLYRIIETSHRLQAKQKEILSERADWLKSLDELPDNSMVGCVVANELLDSFPVHRVVFRSGQLLEIFVDQKNGGLVEVVDELSDPGLQEYFERIDIVLPEGIKTEVNLKMLKWINDVTRILKNGFILSIDYGMAAKEYYSPRRMHGSLRCFRNHRMYDQPLLYPGTQDMTSHVDFTSLHLLGEEQGVETLGYTDQTHFLMGIGEGEIQRALTEHSDSSLESARKRSSIMNLIHPEMMGTCFKILVQFKGKGRPTLSGLKQAKGCLS